MSTAKPEMSGLSKTVGTGTVTDLYHWLLEHGADSQELANITGVSREDVEDADVRLPFERLVALWHWAIAFSNDPALGIHIGGKVDPKRLSIVSQAFFSTDNLLKGIEHYIRFFGIANDSGSLSLHRDDTEAILEFQADAPEFYYVPEIERMLAAAVARGRYFLNRDVNPVRVEFQHKRPDYAERYEGFFKAPVLFDQPRTAIVFDASLLSWKISGRNPFLYQAVTRHAEYLLRRLPRHRSAPSVTRKARDFIRQHLAQGDIDLETTARQLNMSRNSLYRKLKKEGLSFKALVESVRQEEAKRYLLETELPLTEIAFYLGFSELSAFSRAFKRWTSMSPQAFRNQRG